MANDVVVEVRTDDDIVTAREVGQQMARQLGFSLTGVTMVAAAISEVTRNTVSYAGYGVVRIGMHDREGRKALVVRTEDDGPGIPDVERAIEDGYSSGQRPGLGFSGVRRWMDGMIVESVPGAGTVVEMWKWTPPG